MATHQKYYNTYTIFSSILSIILSKKTINVVYKKIENLNVYWFQEVINVISNAYTRPWRSQ